MRSALPHSRVIVHQPLGGVQGQASDILIEAKEIEKLRTELFSIIAEHSGQLLLSDFDWWHAVLEHTYADMLKHKNEPDEEAAIIRSWDNIFDLSQCGHGYTHRRNRWIQATFWELRLEWVKEVSHLK